ncbi:MAG TPA: zinc ribbon domain-containing protein [Acidimicrobiales bacterium]|nr:zinc ribbon domain-containing protein [Acidimicrobiales bacterium]
MAQANFAAANHVKAFVVANRVSKVVYGDPVTVGEKDCGVVHNRRIRRWPRAQQRDALVRRLEELAISAQGIDERGSSSHCPACGARATKSGRWLTCTDSNCGKRHHRDLAASQNIARRGEGAIAELVSVEHRRVGRPARRDRRPALGRLPAIQGAAVSGNARTRAASTASSSLPVDESSDTAQAVA